ncbi:MAG: hypothetical protein MUF15_08155 [Acidobacteria bacterium]|jgi:hypothetical protein|nr:hypothetical protein [Acidobacteriota bacterium]
MKLKQHNPVIFILLLMIVLLAPLRSTANGDLIDPLSPFKPFIGKTWKGTLNDPGEPKVMIDVSHWERALNGNAVRVFHSVNDGEYGGETIIIWDPAKENLVYYYFTTAGFFTSGTMTVENKKFISHEIVTGNKQGITEVKSVSEILPDGKLSVKAQYFQNGKWEDGHQVIYSQDPKAKVVFK